MRRRLAGCSSWMGVPVTRPRCCPALRRACPAIASHAEVAHLIGEMRRRETGHLLWQVQFTQIKDGPVYYFVATYEGPA